MSGAGGGGGRGIDAQLDGDVGGGHGGDRLADQGEVPGLQPFLGEAAGHEEDQPGGFERARADPPEPRLVDGCGDVLPDHAKGGVPDLRS